ncbi:MAG: glycosyltransferase family 39 protein [Flavobacteriales bacterium]|nr:glycosyltransferase family 39 protein [Flavobacteriales bacterium]
MNLKHFTRNWLPYLAIAIVYATGANLDVMEVDAAQYASMSLEMLRSDNWLQVFDRHQNYLDKPPLLFWLSAFSFKLFGIGNWQYKLPSILFSFLGIFSTYKLGKRLYSERIGHHAAILFGSSFAMVMINNDVKTDTILVSAIVFSLWMLVSAIQTNRLKYFIGSALGIGVAMLTKGPIGLMMPALAIGGHVVVSGNWKALLNAKWLVVVVLVSMALVPMCLGLYQQHGTEGLKFYFWTQSFGRITGHSEWSNNTTPLFFLHVYVWSFLPWALLGIFGILQELRAFPKMRKEKGSEFYLLSGIAMVWLALSLSRFKLPHYIFVVYPLISILAAKHLENLTRFSRWAWVQLILSSLSVFLLAFLLSYSFPAGGWAVPILLMVIAVGAIVLFFNLYRSAQVIWPSFIMYVAVGLGMNLHFYPHLLPYQADAYVGRWVKETGIPEGKFLAFSTGGRAFDFYSGRTLPWMKDAKSTISAISDSTVVYATEKFRNDLIKRGYPPKREVVIENFEVQKLTLEFLNPKTRENAVKKRYLMFY